eukprot:296278_1
MATIKRCQNGIALLFKYNRLFCTTTKIQKIPSINALIDNVEMDAKQSNNYELKNINLNNNCASMNDLLSDCKNPNDIILMLQQHQQNIIDSSVYINAMKLCGRFIRDDSRPIHAIFHLLLKSNIELNTIHFNTFFNNVPDDSPLLCTGYFRLMTKTHKLIPDIVTFHILIKGCKTQKRYRTAGKYWYLMKGEYGINPDNGLYKEMIIIYALSHKTDRAQKIFDEYLYRIKKKELKLDWNVFKAYLNAFSSVGDIKGMKNAFKIIQNNGIHINSAIISDIMNGYLIGGHPEKTIRTFNEYVTSGQFTKMVNMLHIKCKALCEMIQNEACNKNNFDRKYELYSELLDTIYNEFPKYGAKISYRTTLCQLQGAIAVYGNDNKEVIGIFESLVDKKYISYIVYYEDINIFGIDLHWPISVLAKFVLEYCIRFKLNELLSVNDYFVIVVGKGLHSGGKDNKKGKFGEWVVNELLTYKPAIKCKYDENNKGRLIVSKSDLGCHFEE